MKRTLLMISLAFLSLTNAMADGWPSNYGGVMLQGFYWDSYSASQWKKLESQAEELAEYFSLIWVPQSGNCNTGSNSMGYLPYYYWDQDSSFGTEEQLRSMISTFKSLGLGTIADVVINHHNTDGWFSFPEETYNGVTYQFQSTDICANDDDGATKTQADSDGISLSSNNDEGDDWSGCRDLDHQSSNVQTIIKAYVKYLHDDLGYAGFRYDMVKGFDGSHVKDYNQEAGVEYSVGEYWDSNSRIENWIKATDYNSAAFDFQFRYNVRDAINDSNWSELYSTNNLMHDDTYKQYAVTFVENHDTEYRSSSEQQDPIKKDTLAANAYMLAMPGTPCVFLTHWRDCKQEIKGMIDARKAIGITNTSSYVTYGSTSSASSYSVNVSGSNGNLLCVVGTTAGSTSVSSSTWTKVASGYHWAYYFKNTNEMVWADKASGEYDEAFDVLLSLVSNTSGTKIVYTTDGTTPSATNGTQLSESGSITISEATTLKVGLLSGSTVSKVITREYSFATEFEPYDITVYVNADEAGSSWAAAYSTASSPYLNFWTWDDNGYHSPTNASWPGDKVTDTAVVDGTTWFTKSYTMQTSDDNVSFVFSVGTGTPQTVDVNNVSETKFFSISSETTASKYKVDDVTSTMSTGITVSSAEPQNKAPRGIYTLDGRKVTNGSDTSVLTKGIYISNGKKIIVSK